MNKKPIYYWRLHMPRIVFLVVAVWLIALATLGFQSSLLPRPVRAQSDALTAEVASEDFPELTVTVLCPKQSTWELKEDGERQSIRESSRQERPKTETTIFLDLYRNQDSVRSEVGKGVERLIALSAELPKDPTRFSLDQDYFSVLTPDENGDDIHTLAQMYDDLGLMFNQVVDSDGTDVPYSNLSETSLSLLLLRALEQMPPSNPQMRRSLVVISDGNDRKTRNLLSTVAEEAMAKRIAIHTIYVRTSPGNKDNLKMLAESTGGTYFESLDLVDWSILASEQRLCDLTYRSKNSQPRRVVVTAKDNSSGEDRQWVSVGEIPTLNVPAPNVMPNLVHGETIHAPDPAGERALPPQEMTLKWDFEQYPNRQLRRLGYEIIGGGRAVGQEFAPPPSANGVVTVPLSLDSLLPGVYNIRAWVEDELGLQGEAHLPLQIVAPPTPPPTATPLPSPTPMPSPPIIPTPQLSWSERVVAWTTTDFPYRRLLLATALTAVLLALVVVQMSRMLRGRQVLPPSTVSLSSEKKARAILYRINSTVNTGAKQTVKLDDRPVKFPDALYPEVDRRRIRRAKSKPEFEAVILPNAGRYYLSPVTNNIQLITPEKSELLDSGRALMDRDEIIFGESKDFHYRYIELGKSDHQDSEQTANGSSTQ